MPQILIETSINAPADICFALTRDRRISAGSITEPGAVIPIELGQKVTFESNQFWVRQRLTVEVVELDRPRLFIDEQIDGPFKEFMHIHEFKPFGRGTLMLDTIIWRSPVGLLGKLADALYLRQHLSKLIYTRNAKLKALAETY
jgi:ligand-binding SRPBCC domain-containing protein